jgi:hypothetical protein
VENEPFSSKITTFSHFSVWPMDVLWWKMIACHHFMVHLTGGILRHFQALSTPKQNPALEVLSMPAYPQVTPIVRQICYERLRS